MDFSYSECSTNSVEWKKEWSGQDAYVAYIRNAGVGSRGVAVILISIL
jgi:hypothetical protein